MKVGRMVVMKVVLMAAKLGTKMVAYLVAKRAEPMAVTMVGLRAVERADK
jgi:hypothetical protein